MSTAPAGFKRNFLQSDIQIYLFYSSRVSRKAQLCRNVEAHRRCVGQTLGTRFKDFFRKSYVLKPSAAETQADIFTVCVYYYNTHFIKILSWVLPAQILFTDVEVHKMVIFCCFCHFYPSLRYKMTHFLENCQNYKNKSSKYKNWPV